MNRILHTMLKSTSTGNRRLHRLGLAGLLLLMLGGPLSATGARTAGAQTRLAPPYPKPVLDDD